MLTCGAGRSSRCGRLRGRESWQGPGEPEPPWRGDLWGLRIRRIRRPSPQAGMQTTSRGGRGGRWSWPGLRRTGDGGYPAGRLARVAFGRPAGPVNSAALNLPQHVTYRLPALEPLCGGLRSCAPVVVVHAPQRRSRGDLARHRRSLVADRIRRTSPLWNLVAGALGGIQTPNPLFLLHRA